MTNEITLLKALQNGATINPNFQPQNNKQAYLAYLCGLNIALPEPRTEEEVLLCKLCVNGASVAPTEVEKLDFSNCSFGREAMAVVFEGLKDVSAEDGEHHIILTGNPCVMGIDIFKAGEKYVKNYGELYAIFENIQPYGEISIGVVGDGFMIYTSLKAAMEDLQGAPYPMTVYWTDTPYLVPKLTDEDMAIATNKGWKLVWE